MAVIGRGDPEKKATATAETFSGISIQLPTVDSANTASSKLFIHEGSFPLESSSDECQRFSLN